MWQDNLTQGFWHNSRPKIAVSYRFGRLGTFSFISVAMIVGMSYVRQTGAIAFPLKEQLPNASTSLAQTPTSPLTLPPAVFPTNQAPAVSVPPLQQPTPAQTPPPVTPTQAPERPSENVSPPPNSAPIIEFGQPLPETTTSAEPTLTPESAIPTLAPATNVVSQEPPATNVNPEILLPSGTQLSLRYPGEKVLSLQAYQLRQEVLLLQEDLRDRNNQVIAPAGTPVIGYFETSTSGSRFIATAIVFRGSNIRFEAESDTLPVTPPEETTTAQSIRQSGTTIEPNQILQVQLQSDWRFSAVNN
ncbi:MAG: hypothetical protein F6K28_42575 [Microcoleus sp. SIO2G3]|nr:hypothetical protein [Microcoleus sp. SIO2G3]